MPFYKNAERILFIIFKLFASIFAATFSLPSLLSIAVTVYNVYFHKMGVSDGYVYPILYKMPFEVSTWPRYWFGFVWNSLNFTVMVTTKALVSMLIFVICIYSIADLKNAQKMASDFSHVRWKLNNWFCSQLINNWKKFTGRTKHNVIWLISSNLM